ncbi:MAG: DUF4232 domain-containing protein [Acidimicrobiales bacterium]
MRRHSRPVRGTLLRRALGWTGALTLIGGLAVWGFPSGPALSSAVATPSCTTANLDVWLNTMGNGAAGSTYYNLNFTNLSAHACTLRGYPGVSGVTQAGIQLGSAASRDPEHAPVLITLSSAKSAHGFQDDTARSTATVILQITDAYNYPPSTCGQVTAAGLRIYPPGQKESTVVPYPFVACANSGPSYLHTEAVEKFVPGP